MLWSETVHTWMLSSSVTFCKNEYNDGLSWSRIPEGAQIPSQKVWSWELLLLHPTHHRNSWTGQMNFSYSLISNSFNVIITVLYLIWNIQVPVLCYTYCDWYLKNGCITQILKSSLPHMLSTMSTVTNLRFFEIIAFGDFSIHWCLQVRI